MKILVVDDSQVNLMIAKELLEEQVQSDGVILCKKPETAMDILASENVGVILLDIIMPKVDGISLLKEIRSKEEYNDVQIVMFTGVSDKESFRQCFENGANDYINKPIDQTEFVARMQAAVKARRNRAELRETQEHLAQTEKLASIGALAAGFAHEINNPIGFVSSNLETLDSYLEKISHIITQYRHVGRMIQDADVSREELLQAQLQIAESEKQYKVDRILADFKPIIDESREGAGRVARIVQRLCITEQEKAATLADMNHMAEEALLTMKREINDVAVLERNLRPVLAVECDDGQIVQVLVSILRNAAQAIHGQNRETPGTIRLDTYTEGAYTVCSIRDNGPGIKTEHLKRIFDPFFTTKDIGSGTGLGLSSSYEIVRNFGGQLLVESEEKAGATFYVKLPSVMQR